MSPWTRKFVAHLAMGMVLLGHVPGWLHCAAESATIAALPTSTASACPCTHHHACTSDSQATGAEPSSDGQEYWTGQHERSAHDCANCVTCQSVSAPVGEQLVTLTLTTSARPAVILPRLESATPALAIFASARSRAPPAVC